MLSFEERPGACCKATLICMELKEGACKCCSGERSLVVHNYIKNNRGVQVTLVSLTLHLSLVCLILLNLFFLFMGY